MKRPRSRTATGPRIVLPALLLLVSTLPAGEIGFLEDFALSDDRGKALERLVPGTEERYYFEALHLQNLGRLDEAARVLRAWEERHGRSPRLEECENRQALLGYSRDPKGTLGFLRRRLGLGFGHERLAPGERTRLPARLPDDLVTFQAFAQRALERHPQTLRGFEDRGLAAAAGLELGWERRRELLKRLRRPDLAGLARLVVDDLKAPRAEGFGAYPIHAQLLHDQLDECVRLEPSLLNQTRFVTAYLTKLQPRSGSDWRQDAAEREAYLDRLWRFVSRLAPAHNSLKAHVLYHRLVHDRALGIHDRARFLTYLKLPRQATYVRTEYLKRPEHRTFAADLGADYSQVTFFPPVGNDEPLVGSYLEHFFLREESTDPYEPYLDDVYLRRLFAETKILAGVGDLERWTAMLPPSEYQALRERVDIDFGPENPRWFAPADRVALDVWVKNVPTLLIKVFEIHTLNYYLQRGQEVDTAVDLDGLIPNWERSATYDDPPLRRVKRHFEFPELEGRGVFVVELIGGGKSSRALVRKGRLRYLSRTGPAGQVVRVLDEENRELPEGRVWVAGREYGPGASGEITVPFTHEPGRGNLVLTAGDFATLDGFDHQSEVYELAAGIQVDRESLLERRKAQVLVRPLLTLNGTPVSLSLLEEPSLVITSTDLDGVRATQEVREFHLFEDRESLHEFQVPPRLARLEVTVQGRVKNLSQGRDETLQASRAFSLGGIERTDKLEDLHLRRPGGEYVLELLGRNGEPRPGRPVKVQLKHRDFRDPLEVTLATDDEGQVFLGPLAGIERIAATGPGETSHPWAPLEERHSYPRALHGVAGQGLSVPTMGRGGELRPPAVSLLEVRGSTYVHDRSQAVSFKDGALEIAGLPAGDYELFLAESGQAIMLRLEEGPVREDHVLGAHRLLELPPPGELRIAAARMTPDGLRLELRNADRFTRVHVFATRYVPEYPPYENLEVLALLEPGAVTVPGAETLYVTGRDIGDEYRYILERRRVKKFPGNMLERPGLVLNPWAWRSTETGRQEARAGGEYEKRVAAEQSRRQRERGVRPEKLGEPAGGFASLEFLARPSLVLANLRPGDGGVLLVPAERLAPYEQVHVLALSPLATASRHVSLGPAPREVRDLSLREGLDPERHFTEQKEVRVLEQGKELRLEDVRTAEFEAYDSLEKVHRLLLALSGDETLAEFSFVLRWPELSGAEKREKYSRYACHELNFFLSRKDPEFFTTAVKPYLESKFQKTFLDRWLLDEPLEGYLEPWAYEQLNVVERILLARKVAGEVPWTRRHIEDLLELVPPDPARAEHLFQTALRGMALEAADRFGLEEARKDAARPERKSVRAPAPAGRAGETLAIVPPGPEAPRAAAAVPGDRALAEKAKAEGLARGEPAVEADLALSDDQDVVYFQAALEERARVRQLFRPLEPTKEWVENNYWHRPPEEQDARLITVNAFWLDFARHGGETPFYSPRAAEASRSFPEMMFALSVLDLPFRSPEHETAIDGRRFHLRARGPMLVFTKEIQPAEPAADGTPVLVSENFFAHLDRYTTSGGEKLEKYVTGEFLTHTPYGGHLVITNPTSARQKLDVLFQVPEGAVPLQGGHPTRSLPVELAPYQTWTADYLFYFPRPGTFRHYPVHVSRGGELVASAKPVTFNAVETPSVRDVTSWEHISQLGSNDDVLEFLRTRNLESLDLEKTAWRMRDSRFFDEALAILERRHAYNHALWSYGILHDRPRAIREYLRHAESFVAQCGSGLESELLVIDPVERKAYQHIDYRPLVNARAHRLGKRRQILNDRLYEQYQRLLRILSYRPRLDDDDLMSVTCYLLLQDRVEEALGFFARVRSQRLASRLQYDYFQTYLGLYTAHLREAREVASRYLEYPVERWRQLFAAAVAQLEEIAGAPTRITDEEDRTQRQTQLAATEPALDFDIEAGRVTLRYQNLKQCEVRYHEMDIELLFSRNPFVAQHAGQFGLVRPNQTDLLNLDPAEREVTFELPERFKNRNVLVEVAGGGAKAAKPYFANELALQTTGNYGQARLSHKETGEPLPEVYVKVYALMGDGRVRFYKDGYTDLRGRFDYVSLSTEDLEGVQEFAFLALSEDHGAVVREVEPPAR